MPLHLDYMVTSEIARRLREWDAAAGAEPGLAAGGWRLVAVWPAARNASVSGSTGIEGNPLTPAQVDDVLAGGAIDAEAVHVQEVENDNRALDLARDAARRSDFAWSHEIIHRVNAAVMEGLPRDTRGDYRRGDEDVHAGIFTAPSPLLVGGLMDELVAWLATDVTTPRLLRSALLHLNLVAIHPFSDGNGRTARVLAGMELVRDGIRAPELIGIEAYLRRNRDEYVDELRTALGYAYDPEDHPATGWLDYYTRISLDRLAARNRVMDALPVDLGALVAALSDAGDPLDWAIALLAARVSRLRTRSLASLTGRSDPAARAELARIAAAGWLEPRGVTRGRWWAPSAGLAEIKLRVPGLMRLLADGEGLDRMEAEPARQERREPGSVSSRS